jgi:hypothetical protein
MNYNEWLNNEISEVGKGCSNCRDKNCDGTECKKYLGFRIDYLKELLSQATGIRKQHLSGSIERCESKLKELQDEKE